MSTYNIENNNGKVAAEIKSMFEASNAKLTTALETTFSPPPPTEPPPEKGSDLGPISIGLYRQRLSTSIFKISKVV